MKNITICKECEYFIIDELIELLDHDWKSANCLHGGIPEYYIYYKDFEKRKEANEGFSEIVKQVDSLLGVLVKMENDIEQKEREEKLRKLCICKDMDSYAKITTAKEDADVRKIIKERLRYKAFSMILSKEAGELYKQYAKWQDCKCYKCNTCGTRWLFVAADFPAPGVMIRF